MAAQHPVVSFLFSPILIALFNSVVNNAPPYNDLDEVSDRFKATYRDTENVFDFIIVGAGSAGCVLGNRLSKKHKVLILEAGGEEQPGTRIPVAALQLLHRPHIDWYYESIPQNYSCLGLKEQVEQYLLELLDTCDFVVFRSIHSSTVNLQKGGFCSGRGLGGSSFLNFLLYVRGSPLDFDNWANLTGDQSWSYDSMLRHFKNIESYKGNWASSDIHGFDGELPVQPPPYEGLSSTFVKAGMELGYDHVDLNGKYKEGFSEAYYSQANGRRYSANRAFLEPIRDRDNLYVYKFSLVSKVLLNQEKVAYGVEYYRHGVWKRAYAKKEVILSAGAIGSPKILMLSGIGPADHLKILEIPIVSDLPVGTGLQDHLATYLGPFLLDSPTSMVADRDLNAQSLLNFINYGVGPYTSTGAQGIASFSSSIAKSKGQGNWPDIQYLLIGTGIHSGFIDDFQRGFGVKRDTLNAYYKDLEFQDAFHIFVSNARPKQTGTVKLRSQSPFDDPEIDPKYLEDEEDLKVQIEGIQVALKLVENTTSFRNVKAKFTDKIFPGCEGLEFRSDAYFDCFARHYSISLHHVCGTCPMGKQNSPSAVVNSRLQVFGTKNLRVIDASIMPKIVASNTNAATLGIAEKASEMILERWR